MKKIELVKGVAISIAAIGVILFWIFGFKGLNEQAMGSLVAAGCFAWVAIFAIIGEAIYKRNHITWGIDRKLPR